LTGVNPNWAIERLLSRLYTADGAATIIKARQAVFWRTADDFEKWAVSANVVPRDSADAQSSMLELP
jgi:hypothetical protein